MVNEILLNFVNEKINYNKDLIDFILMNTVNQTYFLSNEYEELLKLQVYELLDNSLLNMEKIDELRIKLTIIHSVSFHLVEAGKLKEASDYDKIKIIQDLKNKIKSSNNSLNYQLNKFLIESDRFYDHYKTFLYEWEKIGIENYMQELYFKELIKSVNDKTPIGSLIKIFLG